MGSSPTRRTMNTSKRLSYILRHHPESAGLTLDANGWVGVEALCSAVGIKYDELVDIVWNNDKKRFEFDVTGDRIRARQGHSIPVDLELKPIQPPDVLLHGTKGNVLDHISLQGILKMSRQYVQLSETRETALEVANRRSGLSVILEINAKKMHDDGFQFFKSTNNVWMTEHVPPKYICSVTLDKQA